MRDAQPYLIDDVTATRLAETFKALSDPTRVRIISALSHTELCVHDIAATLDMSQSAISHQLRTLRELRLVKFRREGRHIYYALDDEHIQHLFRQGLDHILHD
ncbi:MAG: ArsR/SmtB family transcription factor [Anaerolineae bacterium]